MLKMLACCTLLTTSAVLSCILSSLFSFERQSHDGHQSDTICRRLNHLSYSHRPSTPFSFVSSYNPAFLIMQQPEPPSLQHSFSRLSIQAKNGSTRLPPSPSGQSPDCEWPGRFRIFHSSCLQTCISIETPPFLTRRHKYGRRARSSSWRTTTRLQWMLR